MKKTDGAGTGVKSETTYIRKQHAAARTTDFVFNQLIPYIGNKRKLLDLIAQALQNTHVSSNPPIFLDIFAGSGVVACLAKILGYRVIANDWEPYTKVINSCYIANNEPPLFKKLGGYEKALSILNSLPPRADWITTHLCPQDDEKFDIQVERLFYMRKNGMRINAIRNQIFEWRSSNVITEQEQDCLLAPLLYQACYTSNTSGVFKGFHNGWGGKTGTALYRIAGSLHLAPAAFCDNKFNNQVFCDDAQLVAEKLKDNKIDVVYIDPPYNQHPYGSNYHVLNTIALWDKPVLSKTITRGTKSAIRLDWRTKRRSAYNYADLAANAYARLLETLNARFILTSYSTDGLIPLDRLLAANAQRGCVNIEMKGYKRYRVSSQRFSDKPMNVEFVVILDTHKTATASVEELHSKIMEKEEAVLNVHKEYALPFLNEKYPKNQHYT